MQATRFSDAVQPTTTGYTLGAAGAYRVERAAVIRLAAIHQRRTSERAEAKAARIVRLASVARFAIPAALIALVIGSADFEGAGTLSGKASLTAQLFPDTPAVYLPVPYVNPVETPVDHTTRSDAEPPTR